MQARCLLRRLDERRRRRLNGSSSARRLPLPDQYGTAAPRWLLTAGAGTASAAFCVTKLLNKLQNAIALSLCNLVLSSLRQHASSSSMLAMLAERPQTGCWKGQGMRQASTAPCNLHCKWRQHKMGLPVRWLPEHSCLQRWRPRACVAGFSAVQYNASSKARAALRGLRFQVALLSTMWRESRACHS